MRGWLQAGLVVVILAALAALMAQLPPALVNGVRLFNGLTLLTLLAWIIRRLLTYEAFLLQHREDILRVFAQRTEEYQDLVRRTDEISAQLAGERTSEGRA